MANSFTEMSNYIDLEMYHKYESQHPGYLEMTQLIKEEIAKFAKKSKTLLQILEFGSGTGLSTANLAEIRNVNITAVEPDQNCFAMLFEHIKNKNLENVSMSQKDGLTFLKKNQFDLVTTTFAHHHIALSKAHDFVQNIYDNLKAGGSYILGDELIAEYKSEEERKIALRKYHHHIINLAEDDDHFELAQLEYGALYSGIRKIGDYKRSVNLLEEEMTKNGLFKIAKKTKVPLKKQLRSGAGIYVYKFAKI